MQHLNSYHPNASPLWCNVSVTSTKLPMFDGYHWYYWCSPDRWSVWFDDPMSEFVIEGNVCYRISGNVWICPVEPPVDTLMPVPNPEPVPMPTGNVRPMLSVTSVRMENHPEHISVMFGQVIANLK